MTFKLKKQELALLLAVLFLVAVASFAPALAQPLHPHVYADARGWGFVPCAGDVLSNLPFAVWGAAGLGLLAMGARPRGLGLHASAPGPKALPRRPRSFTQRSRFPLK